MQSVANDASSEEGDLTRFCREVNKDSNDTIASRVVQEEIQVRMNGGPFVHLLLTGRTVLEGMSILLSVSLQVLLSSAAASRSSCQTRDRKRTLAHRSVCAGAAASGTVIEECSRSEETCA